MEEQLGDVRVSLARVQHRERLRARTDLQMDLDQARRDFAATLVRHAPLHFTRWLTCCPDDARATTPISDVRARGRTARTILLHTLRLARLRRLLAAAAVCAFVLLLMRLHCLLLLLPLLHCCCY
jgi:hypothetical protein